MDSVERVGAKCHLREFQDCYCAKKRKVSVAVTEAFEFTTEFFNQEAPADANLSAKLMLVKDVLAAAPVAEKKAKEQ